MYWSEDLCMLENLACNITKHVKTESSTSKNEGKEDWITEQLLNK